MSTENVLQGILSQKIVQDGDGYAARTDIVNVDNITANSITTTSLTPSSINTTGNITAASLRLTSAAGPHITTAGNTLQIATTTAANTGGFFNLNGNTIRDTGGNRTGEWANYITLGSNLNTEGFVIGARIGQIELVNTLDMNTRSIERVNQLELIPESTQAGIINCSTTTNTISGITGVTSTSIVIVTPTSQPTGSYWVTTGTGTITLNLQNSQSINFNYYIAKY
jgi:hypothetical protein